MATTTVVNRNALIPSSLVSSPQSATASTSDNNSNIPITTQQQQQQNITSTINPINVLKPTIYRTPEENYNEAIRRKRELENERTHGTPFLSLANEAGATVKTKLDNMIQKFNNSEILYPAFMLLCTLVQTLIILFQKNVSGFVKFLSVFLYIFVLIMTIMLFKDRVFVGTKQQH